MRDGIKAKTVAVLWVNNDFGKGGRDSFIKEMTFAQHQCCCRYLDGSRTGRFLGRCGKIKAANADAIFVYLNEEESARFLEKPRNRASKTPSLGAFAARSKSERPCSRTAERVRGHVGLPAIAVISEPERRAASKNASTMSAITMESRAIPAIYFIKYVNEKNGKFDSKTVCTELLTAHITPSERAGDR